MKFHISISPDPLQWPIGNVLSLSEAAQLLEVDAAQLAARSRLEPAILEQGFRLRAIPEPHDSGRHSGSAPRVPQTLHEFEAIAFLRALIHLPPHLMPVVALDGGWCAHEHARAAQIALRAVGEDARLAIGTLAYLNPGRPDADFHMSDHRFLLLHRNDRAIFDSAASFPGVEGLAPRWRERHPGLKVVAFEGLPEQDEFTPGSNSGSGALSQVACYFVHEERKLPRDIVSFVMDTPFCQWIEEEFGAQERLWGNVIGTTIRILTGEPHGVPIPFEKANQLVLWDWLQAQPDDREFIDLKLRK